jgi:hypothetical protein
MAGQAFDAFRARHRPDLPPKKKTIIQFVEDEHDEIKLLRAEGYSDHLILEKLVYPECGITNEEDKVSLTTFAAYVRRAARKKTRPAGSEGKTDAGRPRSPKRQKKERANSPKRDGTMNGGGANAEPPLTGGVANPDAVPPAGKDDPLDRSPDVVELHLDPDGRFSAAKSPEAEEQDAQASDELVALLGGKA